MHFASRHFSLPNTHSRQNLKNNNRCYDYAIICWYRLPNFLLFIEVGRQAVCHTTRKFQLYPGTGNSACNSRIASDNQNEPLPAVLESPSKDHPYDMTLQRIIFCVEPKYDTPLITINVIYHWHFPCVSRVYSVPKMPSTVTCNRCIGPCVFPLYIPCRCWLNPFNVEQLSIPIHLDW